MLSNRAGKTSPELALRRALHARGLRYRVAYGVPTMPRRSIDIAFTRPRLAVFVDGCFWHGCPLHRTMPAANASYWSPKLARNIDRDIETNTVLEAHGWGVLRLWEHLSVDEMVASVQGELGARACQDLSGPDC